MPSRQHTNSLLAYQGGTLLSRARDLVRNNPYMASARDSFVANMVGTGIKPSWLGLGAQTKRSLEEAWLTWTDVADADGTSDLYGLQALAASALFEAGECFLWRLPTISATGVPLQLRLIESEQCPIELNRMEANGNQTRCGIELTPSGRRVAYWFHPRHPGDATDLGFAATAYIRVPADQVTHLFRPQRPGQLRGAPWVTAAMVKAFLLDKYDDAELDRKGTAALFAGFVTSPARASSPLAGQKAEPAEPGVAVAGLQPGTLQILEPGEDIKFSDPADVGGQYEAFEYRNLLALCAATGVPYANVTGDHSRANYASQRGGLVEYRRRIEQLQHHVLVFQFCRPVAEAWVRQAALAGVVRLPAVATDLGRYTRIKWITPRFDWVDPLKDRKAEEIAVNNGWKSRSDVAEAEGSDADEVDQRIAADREREQRYGIGPFPRSTKNSAAAEPLPVDDPDSADAGEGANRLADDQGSEQQDRAA